MKGGKMTDGLINDVGFILHGKFFIFFKKNLINIFNNKISMHYFVLPIQIESYLKSDKSLIATT